MTENDVYQEQVGCGNACHPDGPQHPAAPIPPSWERLERFRQWWRRRQYGCGCPAHGTDSE